MRSQRRIAEGSSRRNPSNRLHRGISNGWVVSSVGRVVKLLLLAVGLSRPCRGEVVPTRCAAGFGLVFDTSIIYFVSHPVSIFCAIQYCVWSLFELGYVVMPLVSRVGACVIEHLQGYTIQTRDAYEGTTIPARSVYLFATRCRNVFSNAKKLLKPRIRDSS